MKTCSLINLSLGLPLSVLLLAGGCTQSGATNTEPALTNVSPTAVTPAEDASVVTTSGPTAPRDEPLLPPNILPTAPLAEVIKLAQSGVDENVMLAFITNAVKPFALDAEAIVYLNDLGVSGTVITTMIQHDQGFPPSPSNPATPTAPAPVPVASTPTYVAPATAALAAEAPPTEVSNNFFYDSLAPYGNWVEVEGYGRCWRPTVVMANRNWQPYCDRGHWLYTDAGWYWLSDYSWGATTFHYGRWFTHPSWGWCWWPDPVWAPSWVSWRSGGDYCGWAPLPPSACYRPGFGFSYYGSSVEFTFGFGIGASCYTFVPLGRMCDSRPSHYRLPTHQATQVYANSTVMNHYVSGKNNTVINQGIAPERIREHTRTEIRAVHIRDQAGSGPRNERLERDGRTLVVHRPQLSVRNGSVAGRPSGEPQQRIVGGSPSPGHASSPVAVRPPAVSAPPANSPSSTPKGYQRRIVQSSPQNPSRPSAGVPSGSLIIIGGKSGARSGGSDYSVWSPPSPQSQPNAAGNSSHVNSVPPSACRPWDVEAQAGGGRRSRESRGWHSPAPAPVAVAPVPQVSPPTPGYPSRVESRPTSPPSASPSRSPSRSQSSNGKREH